MFNEILIHKTNQKAFQSIIKTSDSFKACADIEFRKPTDLQTTIQHCPTPYDLWQVLPDVSHKGGYLS